MSLPSRTRVDRFELIEPLGADTQKYKATDTATASSVVVTFLPPGVFAQAEDRDRLQQEVQALSALAHRHIVAPTELGHEPPETDFLVAPFVEGDTLSARLARGPLPIDEALPMAVAVAEALDQAHRRGITHRRLSPEAIILTGEGPMIVDFGAALRSPASSGTGATSVLATRTAISGLTSTRVAASRYTAPEQFDGSPADVRSDIFALGAILYEMVSGKPAFDERTPALLIAAIQTVEPEPLSRLQPSSSPALDHLVDRMLAKDPRQRIQTASDLVAQLRWVADGGSQIGAAISVKKGPAHARLLWVTAAVAAVAMAAGIPVALSRASAVPERDMVRFTTNALPSGAAVPVSVSPDGRWLIGSAGGAGSRGVLALSLDSVAAQTLIPENTVTQAFWSPDGRTLAFFDGGRLKRADIAGGTAQNICETPLPIGGGTWSRDGVMLFSGGGLIHRVLATGGQPTPITALDAANGETEHVGPSFLPDGKHFLYLVAGANPGIYLGRLDSPERMRLFDADSRAVYAEPGYILFNRGPVLFAQPFDVDTRALTGEPLRVVDGLGTLARGPNASPSMTRIANFTVSQNGVLAFKSAAAGGAGADEPRALTWYDRSGNVLGQVPVIGTYAGVDLARDGRRVAVHRHEGSGGDIWSFDAPQGRLQRLTFNASQENTSPVLSRDGTRIAFASRRNEQWGLYVKSADGTGREELILESAPAKAPTSWSPDGNTLVYQEGGDIWAVALTGDKKPFPLVQSPADDGLGDVSPDGKWLAYLSSETGRNEVYVQPFPSGPGRWQISTDGGQYARWGRGGTELYFHVPNSQTFAAAAIRFSGASLEPGAPFSLFTLPATLSAASHQTFYNRFAVSADGSRFLFSLPPGGGGDTGGIADRIAQLADGGATTGGAPSNLTVILNWPKLLRR